MRYLIAILFAMPAALGATIYLSSPVATWVAGLMTYDSPDAVADVHATAFMVTNLVGLVVGWLVGWWFGGVVLPKRREI